MSSLLLLSRNLVNPLTVRSYNSLLPGKFRSVLPVQRAEGRLNTFTQFTGASAATSQTPVRVLPRMRSEFVLITGQLGQWIPLVRLVL